MLVGTQKHHNSRSLLITLNKDVHCMKQFKYLVIIDYHITVPYCAPLYRNEGKVDEYEKRVVCCILRIGVN